MSETREQFRDRMRSIWAKAVLASEYHYDTGGAIADAAEAVYAQALRDVMGLMREREIVAGDFAVTVPAVTDDDLLTFAAERGIDLEVAS